jgi:DNA-binding NarL/FixJ family response regulator
VFSSFDLVAHTVATGLASRGLTAVQAGGPDGLVTPAAAAAELRPGDVGVLIDDLNAYAALRWACGLVAQDGASWLVLTAAPPGPIWGALLQSGATAILPCTTSLDDVEAALAELFEGGEVMDPTTRTDLLALWVVVNDEQERLSERLERLTPQERRVLVQLYDGAGPAVIASRAGVSETTVRSQLKAVFRKLGVHSQLAAVAALRGHREFTRAWGSQAATDGAWGPVPQDQLL